MNAVGWRSWIRHWLCRPSARARPRRLWLEPLEDRTVPSQIFTVTLLGDAGSVDSTDESGLSGDLRYCISRVNSDIYGGTDTIQFKLNSSGVQTINLTSALPALSHPVIFDGTSEPGYAGAPLIVLHGPGGETTADGLELDAGAAGSTIKGLAIDNFYIGIFVNGAAGSTIQGNYIGVGADGATAAGNSQQGIRLEASNCTIGGTGAHDGNVISGNAATGLWVIGDDTYDLAASGNTIEGNRIGTNAAGTGFIGNGMQGLLIQSAHTTSNPIVYHADDNIVRDNIISGNTNSGTTRGMAPGLVLNASGGAGVVTGTKVEGNTIESNDGYGVVIEGGAASNFIDGTTAYGPNVISGNTDGGVLITDSGTNDNVVKGNTLTGNLRDPSNSLLVDLGDGIALALYASGNIIGGTSPGDGNILYGNRAAGVRDCYFASGNFIEDNLIGLDGSGNAPGNADEGVVVNAGAGSITISGNIIGGNGWEGISIPDSSSSNIIESNYIGVTPSGNRVGNSMGVYVSGESHYNIIGGSDEGDGNIISGNTGDGIQLNGSGVYGTTIEGNLIGINPASDGELGNGGNGVSILAGASYNTVGGTESGTGNVIASNTKGVVIRDANSVDNRILANSIFGNAGPGIDLGDDGPTPNSPTGAPATGPNDHLNHPVVTSVSSAGHNAEVAGTLQAFASTTYQIDFFASPANGPPFQGESFLGSVSLTTDATGAGVFDAIVEPPPFGWRVDATATVTGESSFFGDTSEFSSGPSANPTVSLDPVVPGAVGATLQTVGHITDPDGPAWTVSVNYGDGSEIQHFAAGTTFPLQHAYTAEGSYTITVFVTDEAGVSSPAATAKAEVFIAGTNPGLVGVGESDSGHTTTVSAPGVTAQVTHNGPDPAFLLVTPLPPVVRGFSLVTNGPGGVMSTVSYDVRGVNLSAGDVVVVQFSYPADDTTPQLFYFDAKTGNFQAIPSDVNQVNHIITVVFTRNSTPSVTDLNGTVFTITAAPVIATASSNIVGGAGSTTNATSTSGQVATGGFKSLGSVLAAAVGAFTVGVTGSGDGGGGGADDPTTSDGPTAVQEILGDLPTGTTLGGDAGGTPPGTAVLSPSQATLPDGSPNTPARSGVKPMPAPPDGPGLLRLWLTAPETPMVAWAGSGAVQRAVVKAAAAEGSPAAPVGVDLAVAAGLPFAVLGLRSRKGRRRVGKVLLDT